MHIKFCNYALDVCIVQHAADAQWIQISLYAYVYAYIYVSLSLICFCNANCRDAYEHSEGSAVVASLKRKSTLYMYVLVPTK